MTIQTAAVLKTFFETGDIPTQTQFGDLIDTFAQAGAAEGFDTISDLGTASPAPADKQIIVTRGYTTAGDDGANIYLYRTTGRSGVTVDNGWYIAGPGADDYYEAVDKTAANVRQFGAVADGVTDDTAAIQAAIDAAESVYATTTLTTPVLFPRGDYLVTSTLTVNPGVSLLGTASNRGARIVFTPTASDTCIHVNPAAAVIQMTGSKIENLWIRSRDTSWNKTAIDVEDVSDFLVHNVEVDFISGGGRDDIGIYCRGRENSTYSHLLIRASVPIRIGKPTSAVNPDNHVFRDLYLISDNTTATLTRACILIDDNCQPSWVHVMGRNAFAKGDHAVYHASPTALSRTQSMRFENIRFEQGTAPTKHAFHFDYPSGGVCESVTLRNIRVATSSSLGIYSRYVLNLHVENFLRADAGATAAGAMLNIDSADSCTFTMLQLAAAGGAATENDYMMGSMTCVFSTSDLQSTKFPLNSVWIKNWYPTFTATGQPLGIRDNLGTYTRVTRINHLGTELQSFISGAGVLAGHAQITVVGVGGASTVLESGIISFADRQAVTTRGFKLVSGTENFNCIPAITESFNVYASGPLSTITFENLLGEDVYVMIEARMMFDPSASRTVQSVFAPAGP